MRKKLAIIFTIAFSIITITSAFAKAQSGVTVTDRNINRDTALVKVSAQLPIISTSDKKIGDELSNSILNRFENTVADVTQLAQLDKNDSESTSFKPYEVNSTYDVAYNKNDILSFYVITYQTTGGAHGLSTLDSYNLNSKTGEKLTLSNIFKPGFDYKKLINDSVNKKIASNPNFYFQDEEKKFKGISDNHEFYINDKGIVIIFQLYEIAPYASGIQEVVIPKESIQNNMSVKIW
ncbi:DUF3298 and DUF4163 domain-containing protein [Clostridium sp.]|uniref:DUF3298 and DUF4163 domain-containing protein n=1 Tax=Clostridium sp. TaxID=1506 RepID=UPI0039919F22